MATFRVGTRKGLFVFKQDAVGSWSQQGQPEFLGEPVTMLQRDERCGDVYAALNLGHFGVKLHRQDGSSGDWQEVAVPEYPQQKEKEGEGAALQQIWELVMAGSDRPGALWAGTIPGGLFYSEDRGDSWQLIESLWQRPEREQWFGGGYDAPGIHSICVHPQDSAHITLAISCGGVWESRDAGCSWSQDVAGLRAEYLPPDQACSPVSQDVHRLAVCDRDPQHMWVQHHNGIFRSEDGGHQWSEITDVSPSVFGFAVAVHPQDPQTAWFVPGIKDEYRVPVDARLLVNRTRDGGRSFEALTEGLPEEPSYDLVYRHALDIDDSGDLLAFGSTTGNLWVSENQGDHWQCLSHHLPPVNVVRFDKGG